MEVSIYLGIIKPLTQKGGKLMSHSKIRRPALVSLVLSLALLLFCGAALAAGTLNLSVPDTAMPGGEVEIRGSFSGDGAAGTPIGITVKDPSAAVIFAEETKTDSDGSFVISFTLPGNASYGYWQAQAAGGGCAASETFKVGAADGVVNVSPASVKPGGVVTISGTVPQGNVPVGITIKDPNGSAAFVDQATAGAGGGYTFLFNVPASAPTGTWTVDAAGGGSAGRAAFTVVSGSSGGGGGSASPCKQPAAASYLPQSGASDVALDAEVSVVFEIAVSKASATSLNGITITDEHGNKVGNVAAVLSGTKLTLSHDAFEYNTKYTVTIPEAVLANSGSGCSGYHNKSINWSFTTLKKTEAPAAAVKTEYTDVPSTYWAFNVITELGEKGIITGYPDGSFKPDSSITRAEFVAILGRALGWEEKAGNPAFSDAAEIPDWARGYIFTAVDKGVIGGYEDNSFRANQPITRLEIVIIIVRALGLGDGAAKSGTLSFSDAAEIPDWAANDIAIAVEQGIATGKPGNVFAPNDNATRAEAASLIARMLSKF
ncbi:MAG TPA: hypothetical protein DCK76_02255 [Desulfotomaculum sp.]|nr:hypothetical protein [Desulfotomaculum sp.]HBY04269.1 hypothetical protein [Desulfotomaculum sp.]